MAHDVFISHSTQDKVAADAICHGLEAEGVRCWIAPRDVTPGADWQQAIMDAISACKAVVLVFSAHTNQSENVKKEISAAFDANAVVIPFRIEDVLPEGSLKYHLIGVHWLNAFPPPMDEQVSQLAKSIHRLIGGAELPPRPIEAPPAAAAPAAPAVPPGAAPVAPTTQDQVSRWMQNPLLIGGGVVALALLLLLVFVRPHAPVNVAAASSASSASSTPAPSSAVVASVSSAAVSEAPSSDTSMTQSAPSDTSGAPSAPDRHVRIINDTEHTMEHFYASNIDRRSWEEDILGQSVLTPGQSVNINIDDGTGHCAFDFKAVFDDGKALYRHAVNVCNITSYRYTQGGD